MTAIERVWDEYCKEAIESKSQVELIVKVYEHYHGKKWRKSKSERDGIKELTKPIVSKAASTSPMTDKKCIHGVAMDKPCTGCMYSSGNGWM